MLAKSIKTQLGAFLILASGILGANASAEVASPVPCTRQSRAFYSMLKRPSAPAGEALGAAHAAIPTLVDKELPNPVVQGVIGAAEQGSSSSAGAVQ